MISLANLFSILTFRLCAPLQELLRNSSFRKQKISLRRKPYSTFHGGKPYRLDLLAAHSITGPNRRILGKWIVFVKVRC